MWRRTPASAPAGHDPRASLRTSHTVPHGPPLPAPTAGQPLPDLQVAEQAKTHGGRDGSTKSTEQPRQAHVGTQRLFMMIRTENRSHIHTYLGDWERSATVLNVPDARGPLLSPSPDTNIPAPPPVQQSSQEWGGAPEQHLETSAINSRGQRNSKSCLCPSTPSQLAAHLGIHLLPHHPAPGMHPALLPSFARV